jgi:hypothetical protein
VDAHPGNGTIRGRLMGIAALRDRDVDCFTMS